MNDGSPVILLAHEPDIFPDVPKRVSLTLSGHTHGGQIRLFGYSPVVPSRFGNRYAYGHVVEDDRHLIVSGGLGFSILPIRFGVRPEILSIELGSASIAQSSLLIISITSGSAGLLSNCSTIPKAPPYDHTDQEKPCRSARAIMSLT